MSSPRVELGARTKEVMSLHSKIQIKDLIEREFPEVDRSLGEDYFGVTWNTAPGRTQHVMALVLDEAVFLWSPFARIDEITVTRALANNTTLFGMTTYRHMYALKHFILSSDLGADDLLNHIGFIANAADAIEAKLQPDTDRL